LTAERSGDWARYQPAISRWEALTRPAPPPTELNRVGGPRVNVAFVEFMMGWPAGWVTDSGISRSDQLWMIGNGVVPQQASATLDALLLRNATGEIMNESQ
jgi:DNA (cytosine-5)-methyltransferase 1